MSKQKRIHDIGYRERILFAKGFDFSIFTKPRNFTRHMSSIVCHPELINDIGRTVDVRLAGDNRFSFELRQKRYLGRGTYVISALGKGVIRYDEASQQTQISGFVQIGGKYVSLLTIMSLFVLLSFPLSFITILFLPLSLLMFAVIGLHWSYLFADRDDLRQQLIHLLDLTEASERVENNNESFEQSHQPENILAESTGLEQ